MIGLPGGLTFSKSAKSLSKGIAVKGPGGQNDRFKATVRHRVLTITLSSSQPRAQVTIAYPAIGVSSSLAGKVKRHKVKTSTFVVKAIDTSHDTTRLTIESKIS